MREPPSLAGFPIVTRIARSPDGFTDLIVGAPGTVRLAAPAGAALNARARIATPQSDVLKPRACNPRACDRALDLPIFIPQRRTKNRLCSGPRSTHLPC